MVIQRLALALLLAVTAGCRTVAPSSPASLVTFETMKQEVKLICPESTAPTDDGYYCPSRDELDTLFPKTRYKYESEIWDCDDIAQASLVKARTIYRSLGHKKALAVGLITYRDTLTSNHAAVVVRLGSGEWVVYDPGGHRWIPLPHPRKIHWIFI